MRISHQHRFIFFANPKTGSSSIRQFLNPYSDIVAVKNYLHITDDNPFYPHMPPLEAKPIFEQLGWPFADYLRFVFVRNPWARLVSLYEHIHRLDPGAASFEKWLLSIKPFGTGGGGEETARWQRYGAYSIEHFIKDDAGNVLVDKVLRLEDIDEQFIPFLRAMNLPINQGASIFKKNVRDTNRSYRHYYNDTTAQYVADIYRYDIINYDYQF